MSILNQPFRHSLHAEGTERHVFVVAAFASWIWELGHVRLIIQSDGEPAILALVAAVRDKVIADGKS